MNFFNLPQSTKVQRVVSKNAFDAYTKCPAKEGKSNAKAFRIDGRQLRSWIGLLLKPQLHRSRRYPTFRQITYARVAD